MKVLMPSKMHDSGFYADMKYPDPTPDNLTERQTEILMALAGELDEGDDDVIISEAELDWLLRFGFMTPLVSH